MTDTMVFSLVIMGVLVVLLGVLRLRQVSVQSLVLGLIGAILGLLLGALASVPLSKLNEPLGNILPMVVTAGLTITLMGAVLSRRASLSQLPLFHLADTRSRVTEAKEAEEPAPAATVSELPQILVDTSVIIDGRIADIATAGFVPGRLSVPRFVLAELQNIADSDDAMRRGRGRRGLDVLNRLREMPDLEVSIIEDDISSIREVDAKLVALAQKFSCNVLTTDYNLNRVAQIQGVRVLNVNELSNAIRPVVLPGEELIVRVVQPGKERNQGVGYLADGTMIVVENGDRLMGQEVATEVTRVFQTVAGKMIFAVPRKPIPGLDRPEPTSSAQAGTKDTVTTEPPVRPAPSKPVLTPAEANPDTKTEKPASVIEADGATPRKPRFGRNRKRGGGNGSNGNNSGSASVASDIVAPSPAAPSQVVAGGPSTNQNRQSRSQNRQPSRPQSIEDRIIAATSQAPAPKAAPTDQPK